MDNEHVYPVFEVAHVASAASAIASYMDGPPNGNYEMRLSTTKGKGPIPNPVTNFQLAFWRDALCKYKEAIGKEHPNPEDLVLIMAALGFSLTFLFGVNFETSSDSNWTPTMVDMAKEWKLHEDNEELFKSYKDLSDFFTQKIRHTDAKKIQSSLMKMDKVQIRKYLITAQNLWTWFIRQYYRRYGNGIVPCDQLKEFQEEL
jgi:hypothetical protein